MRNFCYKPRIILSACSMIKEKDNLLLIGDDKLLIADYNSI